MEPVLSSRMRRALLRLATFPAITSNAAATMSERKLRLAADRASLA